MNVTDWDDNVDEAMHSGTRDRGDAQAVLERLRTRLLDLTLSNRLLNFKQDGARVVRVVDELPDQLFERLRAGAELELVPIPEPPKDHPLRARVREGEKKARQGVVAAYASELGFDTSFDLPQPKPKKQDAKHSDDAIQTLMFPSDLERALRAIASDARTAIEEKGSNILYMSFGFLEWYEAESSDKALLSPLLMLPVSLRRGETDRKSDTYRFYVSYSNEDVLPNISLQEKLRRDRALAIPDFEEDDAPETYFARIADSVALPERWKIRRQISIGLLAFSKLFMYRDLDPAAWPSHGGPAAHPRVAELLGSGGDVDAEQTENVTHAGEYDFEGGGAGPTPPVVPPIVIDADSSQHSAIVDAFAGKSLVIEGPPGTGKSQTIANLIAAAMSAGKTVLFVAEKLTALEVVKRRLDDSGLGAFCLELHSDKTQKSRLMEELKARLEMRGTMRSPADIDARIRVLEGLRTKLNSYARRVNRVASAMGWTVHDVLWGTQRRRSLLGDAADLWRAARFPNAERLTLAEYEELRRWAGVFAQALGQVQGGGKLASHPFWGVWSRRTDPAFEHALGDALEALENAARYAQREVGVLSTELGGSCPESADALQVMMMRVNALYDASQQAVLPAARALWARDARRELGEWLSRVVAFNELRANVERRLPDPDGRQAVASLDASAFAVVSSGLPLADVVAFPDAVARAVAELTPLEGLVRRVAAGIEDSALGPTLSGAQVVADVIGCVRRAPFDVLAFRVGSAEENDALLDHAMRNASSLRGERAALAEDFDLALLPDDPAVLEAHAATCATAGFFAFFSSAYRAAKRQFGALSRQSQKTTDEAMAAGFRALASFQKKRLAFETDATLRSAFGAAFQGIDTDFEKILLARAWQKEVLALHRRHRLTTSKIGPLADAPVAVLRELAEVSGASSAPPSDLSARVRDLLEAAPERSSIDAMPIASVQAALTKQAQAVAPLRSAVLALRGQGPRTVGELAAVHQELQSLRLAQQEIESAQLPRAALGETLARVDVPVAVVRATLEYAAVLYAPETPELLREYLVRRPSPDFAERLMPMFASARNAITAFRTAERRFLDLGEVIPAQWYGDAGVVSIQSVLARTSRALESRHALPAWASYLRARISLASAGGDILREVAEREPRVDLRKLSCAAEYVVYASIADQIFASDPDLAHHEGVEHASVREQFRKYDEELLRLERTRMAALIDTRPVPVGMKAAKVKDMTELKLLEHEIRKQRAHAPIRQLVNRAGGALRGLMPCFMMSPRSVAQYLKPGSHEFDLVVMDEASQLRPEDAMGAVLRGKQLVVVGDSKQLPPTSFFTAEATDGEVDPDDEIGETITDNKESILDLARTVFRTVRRLRWHYRSRHGSLIAFSNDRYYDGNLIVFPSAHDEGGDLGVRLVQIDKATYADGRNKVEAEAVVEAVIDHLRTRPNETLGIVALNIRQKELIEQLLYDRLKDEPQLRERFDRAGENDGGFIKNLESVQGDERDVIYISVTYGPSTPGGAVARRFGPINAANGWRRLNVLFTRAKRRVVVFSSFAPEALGDQGLSRGAKDLRDYIAFARTGQYQQAQLSDREPDSDFENEVAEVLRSEGYSVTPQVGVAGYFIDLGVRALNGDGRFLLGIECDGAPYHSSFSARDRDRLRQQVLEGLGWKIHRIWSTDWYRDSRAQRRRLVEAVRQVERTVRAK